MLLPHRADTPDFRNGCIYNELVIYYLWRIGKGFMTKTDELKSQAEVNTESSNSIASMQSNDSTDSTIEEKAFIAYYKLGESRSYPKLKSIIDKVSSHEYSIKSITNWSIKYGWQKRIDEIDKTVKEKIDIDLAEDNYRAKKELISVVDSCLEIAKKKIESKQLWVKNIDDIMKIVKMKQELIGDSPSNDIKIVIERADRVEQVEVIEKYEGTAIEVEDEVTNENEVTDGD